MTADEMNSLWRRLFHVEHLVRCLQAIYRCRTDRELALAEAELQKALAMEKSPD